MMKHFFLVFFSLLIGAGPCFASPGADLIFSQEVFALTAAGEKMPTVAVDPLEMENLRRLDFDLGRGRVLRIETNLDDAEKRGLPRFVSMVRECFEHIEASTGRSLDGDILLYLIGFDEVPISYSFQAAYSASEPWLEVRLLMVEEGEFLSGGEAADNVVDFLYDTLPHELGHDVLNGMRNLEHDIDGRTSFQTRWFIEGVCEYLAKTFSRGHTAQAQQHGLAMRAGGSELLTDTQGTALFGWQQQNDLLTRQESNRYGGSMWAMMAWFESIPLKALLDQVESAAQPMDGKGLVALLQQTAGIAPDQLLTRAYVMAQQKERLPAMARARIEGR
ncbi:MAG: hypothetical protein C0614_09510 [Desulfuromonas sp.]|nr:MAG: hypothetical protein C0614_09510 [Desulfuromonas sp.]